MLSKRRVVALKFTCGLKAGELRAATRMLESAVELADKAEADELVHALRGVNVADSTVELIVALDGYGNVADGVRKTRTLVGELLGPSHVDLDLASAKVRKA